MNLWEALMLTMLMFIVYVLNVNFPVSSAVLYTATIHKIGLGN